MNPLALPQCRNYAASMTSPALPFRRLTCGAALVTLLIGSGAASATPIDVQTDYNADGQLDGQVDKDPGIDVVHTLQDVIAAARLIQVQQPTYLADYLAKAEVYNDEHFLGIQPSLPAAESGPPNVPEANVPMWTVLTAGGAGLLVLGGVGSAFYRRTRRPVA